MTLTQNPEATTQRTDEFQKSINTAQKRKRKENSSTKTKCQSEGTVPVTENSYLKP